MNPVVFLPNLAAVPFGRSNADDVAALVGGDLRLIPARDRGLYRSIGSDPCEYFLLPDGRVVLERSRQMRGLTEVVVFESQAAWQAWRRADAEEWTYWGVDPDAASCDRCGDTDGPFRETAHAERICVNLLACERRQPRPAFDPLTRSYTR